MIGGPLGFYLGIDTTSTAFHSTNGQPVKGGREDATAEFWSAMASFSRGSRSFAAGGHDFTPPRSSTIAGRQLIIGGDGWLAGAMQVLTGAMDTPSPLRRRQSTAPTLAQST